MFSKFSLPGRISSLNAEKLIKILVDHYGCIDTKITVGSHRTINRPIPGGMLTTKVVTSHDVGYPPGTLRRHCIQLQINIRHFVKEFIKGESAKKLNKFTDGIDDSSGANEESEDRTEEYSSLISGENYNKIINSLETNFSCVTEDYPGYTKMLNEVDDVNIQKLNFGLSSLKKNLDKLNINLDEFIEKTFNEDKDENISKSSLFNLANLFYKKALKQ